MIGGQVDIRAVNCEAFALAVVEFLHLDRTSVDNPPPEMMKNCRKLCVFLKQQERIDIVRELKIKFPNGMTGWLIKMGGGVSPIVKRRGYSSYLRKNLRFGAL